MKIGLLGHGVVGSGVTKIIDRGATPETKQLEVVKILVKDESEMTDPRTTTRVEDIINDPEIDAVCECMGGIEPAHSFLKKALENGKSIVTSNKKMMANSFEDLYAASESTNAKIQYEASCGGGIPWMHELSRIQRIDKVSAFRGIFNGTSNYILDRMTKEQKGFAEMLEEAQALGYAERDPSDDIDGYDTRYKTALSALNAFHVIVDPNEIPTYGIRGITKEDIDYCRENGYVCRLLGCGVQQDDFLSLYVRPFFLKKEDELANISLNNNGLCCKSTSLGWSMYMGQGAGSLPTAHAVVQDLIDLALNEVPAHPKDIRMPLSSSGEEGVFYIRTKKTALFNPELVAQRVGNETLLTKKTSFMDVNVALQSIEDETLFLAEVEQ